MQAQRATAIQHDATETIAPDAGLDTAIDTACARIAPLWPLKHFVAVNPFLGFAEQTFAQTCSTMRRIVKADMLMPRAFYRARIEAGYIEDVDLRAAIAGAPAGMAVPPGAASLRAEAFAARSKTSPPGAVVATVADILDGLSDGDREASRTAFMVDEISKWCAAYFDEGQAAWKMPWRGLKPYAAWREAARHDRNPEVMGVNNFRATVARLPPDARDTIAYVVAALGIPAQSRADYLYRALFDIQGWAAYARYRVWDNELYGRPDDTLVELLAIRVAWGFALFKQRSDERFTSAWAAAMAQAAARTGGQATGGEGDKDLEIDLLLHNAYEAAYQRRLFANIAGMHGHSARAGARKSLQAAFCIDVRSEVFRRALEAVAPECETLGFAGFFGFPIEYIPIGNVRGGAQCPVLLTPKVIVCEQVAGASEEEEVEVLGVRLLRRRAHKAWKGFKLSAVSSFTFVETLGLWFAAKIVGDSLGLSRPVPHPSYEGLDADVAARVGPRLDVRVVGGRATGFDAESRPAMAEAVLRAMSLTGNFARLVMLTGHGSTTVNNPHASGLDCGACGGHTGEANARVAAAILNDRGVRIALKARGIDIPSDTVFLGCLHDTTTDDVRIFDEASIPASHAADLKWLKERLARAGELARRERGLRLGLGKGEDANANVKARSRDWSQVRPEWGLAGNAAFIAAPRERTSGLDLQGRAFLHNYDWTKDDGFGVLELIMTAPMVVASWINLQYFGSTVNNRLFGSGNKTLHNVVGALGVLEGNAGDLRPGLPWQSVHDGCDFVHEPLRLNVLIEAPESEMNRIVAKHEGVRRLVDNGWVHLFALGGDRTIRRYRGKQTWETVEIAGA